MYHERRICAMERIFTVRGSVLCEAIMFAVEGDIWRKRQMRTVEGILYHDRRICAMESNFCRIGLCAI